MELLFFRSDGELSEVFRRFFAALGVSNYEEGDSANVRGGVYGNASLFGMRIKIEGNSYDFEDDYNYMVSIEEDVLSSLKVDASLVQALALIVAKLLADNAAIAVARETNDGLVLVHQQVVHQQQVDQG